MNIFQEKTDCCGCGACMNICPAKAVSMQEDEEGFLYPIADDSLCASCNKCREACAFTNGYQRNHVLEVQNGFAVKHKDVEVRENSRSGGMFTALSDFIFSKGGAVYGAGYSVHFSVMHKRAVNAKERDEFRGSKYVQSEIGNVYQSVEADLEDGKYVLFSGTACQAAGLRGYLRRYYRNLFIIDTVCHGTPSPKIWQDFLRLREEELNGSITHVDFRNKKKHGWKAHFESVTINGTEHSSRIYTKLFYQNAVLRPSCYHCKYSRKRRPGDITLADFWGHEDAVPGFHEDNIGISLVLTNTKRGRNLFNVSCKDVEFINCTGYKYRHINMRRPSRAPENREEFWEDYYEHGFQYVAEKYAGYVFQGDNREFENNEVIESYEEIENSEEIESYEEYEEYENDEGREGDENHKNDIEHENDEAHESNGSHKSRKSHENGAVHIADELYSDCQNHDNFKNNELKGKLRLFNKGRKLWTSLKNWQKN